MNLHTLVSYAWLGLRAFLVGMTAGVGQHLGGDAYRVIKSAVPYLPQAASETANQYLGFGMMWSLYFLMGLYELVLFGADGIIWLVGGPGKDINEQLIGEIAMIGQSALCVFLLPVFALSIPLSVISSLRVDVQFQRDYVMVTNEHGYQTPVRR